MNVTTKVVILLLVALTALACSSRHTIRPGDSIDVAYEKAMGLYERERYSQAVNAFETVLSMARGTDMAADAQYYLRKVTLTIVLISLQQANSADLPGTIPGMSAVKKPSLWKLTLTIR